MKVAQQGLLLLLGVVGLLGGPLVAQQGSFPWKDGDPPPPVAGILLGANRSEVVSSLGRADSVSTPTPGRTSMLFSSRGVTVIHDEGPGLGFIGLFTREAGEIGGLRVGDSREALEERWGPRHAGRGEMVFYTAGEWTVWVHLDQMNEFIYRIGIGRNEFFPASDRGFMANLRRVVSDLYAHAKSLGILTFLSLTNFVMWRKYKFWVPRYVHLLALLAFATIVALNWMWIQAGGDITVRRFIICAFFPMIVYFIFVGYGGVKAAMAATKA